MRGSDIRAGAGATPAETGTALPKTLLALLTVGAALPAAGCGEEPAPARTEAAVAADSADPRTTEARYGTTVGFASPDSDVGLLLRFEQTTAPGRLVRRYEGWLHRDAGWRSVLSLADTLPVPRARWRILPGGSLRLEAATGGEIEAYRLSSGGTSVVLEMGETASSWPSPTGQRDRLRRARLLAGGDTVDGLAVVRRSAHPLADESPDPGRGFLLLAVSAGEGLVVTLPEGGSGAAAAHGRIGDRTGPWDSVAVELPEDGEPGAVRLADGSLEVELEAPGGEAGARPGLLRGRLAGADPRPVRGLLVRDRER